MVQDTLVVLSRISDGGTDWLPLWTGLIGGLIGFGSTYFASSHSRAAALAQIDAQRDLATAHLKQQATASERQLRASVLAANRIRWIEQLRNEVAAFVGVGLAVVTDLASTKRDISAIYGKIDAANKHAAVISLLLNHDEPASQGVYLAADEVMEAINAMLPDEGVEDAAVKRVETQLKEMERRTRALLKQEWNRVKTLE